MKDNTPSILENLMFQDSKIILKTFDVLPLGH